MKLLKAIGKAAVNGILFLVFMSIIAYIMLNIEKGMVSMMNITTESAGMILLGVLLLILFIRNIIKNYKS